MIAEFTGRQWALDPFALQRLAALAADAEPPTLVEALEAYKAKPLRHAEQATIRDGVAIIPLHGVLAKRPDLFSLAVGINTFYEVPHRDLQAALDSPSVHGILLDIDSPGGQVEGVLELASAVRAAEKPVVAFAGDIAASAAYVLASAADKIVIGRATLLGSIGVRSTFVDRSARDEARGTRTVDFVSSQTPAKRTDLSTDTGRAKVQSQVDALAAVLIETVAEYRDVTVEQVLSLKGDVLLGQRAIDAGLADEIGSVESALASLAGRTPSSPASTTARTPPVPSPTETAVAAALVKERARVAAILAMPGASEAEQRAAIAAGTNAVAFEAEHARRKAILGHGDAPLMDKERAIESGMSAMAFAEQQAAVRRIIAAGKLARGEASAPRPIDRAQARARAITEAARAARG